MRPRGPRQALAVLAVGLTLWMLLDSTAMYREAQASPFGARRTVALAVLAPVAAVSRLTGADWPVDTLDRLLGRESGGTGSVAVVAGPGAGHGRRSRPRGGHHPGPAARAATATTSTTLEPEAGAAPVTPGAPPRLLVIGDSLGRDMGDGLAQMLGPSGIEVDDDARPSTGLARPDYFDWPARLRSDLDTDRPTLVVVMVGGNDAQPFMIGNSPTSFASPAWDSAYQARVREIVSEVSGSGARLLWVGIPICASPQFSADMAHLDSIYRSVVPDGPTSSFFDSWSLFTTPAGSYASYLPGPGGQPELVRQPDGIHLTTDGVNRLDTALTTWLRSRSWLPG